MAPKITPPPAPSGIDTQLPAAFSHADYGTVLDGVPFAVFVRQHHRFLYANRAGLELLGIASLEALEGHGLDLVHPDDRENILALLSGLRDGERYVTLGFRLLLLDGGQLDMEAACTRFMLHGEPALEMVLRDVTNRKRSREMIRRQSAVMDGINRILHAALKFETEAELGSACLEIAEELTQSTLGFIGDVKEKGLEKITLHLPHGQPKVFANASIPKMPGGGFDMHSLYGSVLTDGLSFFTNDPAQFERWGGAPHGHPMLASFMGVPLKHEGKTIGMIGLANRPGGYTTVEQDSIEALAPAIVEAFMRKRMEAEMQQLYDQTRRDAITKSDLLNEINHRVKNNLMTILGLILAEKRHMPQDQLALTEHIWGKFEMRISGLLKVHQMLSDVQWTPMNISELAWQICSGILDSFDMTDTVVLRITPSDVVISPRQSNNIALIFNELMTNSLKYAFGRTAAPAVTIEVRGGEKVISIMFRDNGAGYPEDVLTNGRSNVGLRLVHQLVADTLDGTVSLMNSGGAVTEICFQSESAPRTSQ